MSSMETTEVTIPKEHQQVIEWRMDELMRAGYPASLAADIAESSADLHLAVRILQEGCDPATAAEILL